MSEPRFYIWASDDNGDLALWWNPNGAGYTTNLDKAGLYTAAEYRRYAGHVKATQIAVPEAVAKEQTHRAVRAHHMVALKPTLSQTHHHDRGGYTMTEASYPGCCVEVPSTNGAGGDAK